jgi:hypothetical protein
MPVPGTTGTPDEPLDPRDESLGPKQHPDTPAWAPEPEPMEVESAQLLANHARPVLRQEGFTDLRIDELADAFIAKDIGEATDDFIRWARTEGPAAPGEDRVL